jgi:carboxymethylenebutenolidase
MSGDITTTLRAMTDIKRYLVEEVVVDHGDGLISRRAALHRLTLLGLGAAAASAMLAACDSSKQGGPPPTAAPPSATPIAPRPPGRRGRRCSSGLTVTSGDHAQTWAIRLRPTFAQDSRKSGFHLQEAMPRRPLLM